MANTGNIELTGVEVYTSLRRGHRVPSGDANSNRGARRRRDLDLLGGAHGHSVRTQGRLDEAPIVNTAYVETVEVPGPTSIALSTPVVQTAQMTVTQTVNTPWYPTDSSTPIAFTIKVANAGSVDLTMWSP